ncbi:MAG: hypothetical protein WBA83_05320 [Burkholderiaceae bacterium]
MPEPLSSFSMQGLRWESVQSMFLSGVPAHVRPFASDLAALPVARSLAAHVDLFQRVLVTPGTIILSGWQANWHWLAQVDALSRGAKGYVSAMRVDPAASAEGAALHEPGFSWLPAASRRQFVYRDASPSAKATQHVYRIGLPMQALTAYVRRQLRAEGWEAEPAIAGLAGHSIWRHGSSRLTLFSQPVPSGTDLYIHHVE